MKIYNVVEIFDNGECMTIVTATGNAIHLPADGKHSIIVDKMDNPNDNYKINLIIDLYQE